MRNVTLEIEGLISQAKSCNISDEKIDEIVQECNYDVKCIEKRFQCIYDEIVQEGLNKNKNSTISQSLNP